VSALLRQAQSNIRRWREDPVCFVREVFRVEPDPWQVDMLRAFPKHNRLGAKACKGPGKTGALSWLGWNFLLTRPHSKVPCTSITGDNLRDGLWAEFAKWQHKSELLKATFQWNAERIVAKDHPETWFASARTWPRQADPTQQANTLAGIHADYVLFLIDEVSDIPDGVVAAAEGALTSGIETKLVIAGNCTRTDGPLHRAWTTDRRLWWMCEITGDPDDPKRSPRINIDEARAQIEKYGRESYIVKVNILGQFPDRQADKLLGADEVAAAMGRGLNEGVFAQAAKILGVDPARYGDDDSVIAPRQGLAVFPLREFHGLDTVQLADQTIRAIQKWEADRAFIDEGGVGAGVVDTCRSRGFAHLVEGVNFGSRAIASDRFENRRAEMYWNAGEAIRNGASLPADPRLAEELQAPIYWFDKKQRICLEPKEDIKARIGRSPDRADAYVLTYAAPVAAPLRDLVPGGLVQHRGVVCDYDPFAEGRA
jgi:phage terminase large subunit